MYDSTNPVHTLLAAADELPTSNAQLAILEEAVRVADTLQDVRLGIQARRPLMGTARSLLRGDILTTAFVWCLGQYDREPARFAGWNLFTEYRWVIGQLANLDTISRATLEEMLADYGRRLEQAGYSPRHLHYARQQLAPDLGDRTMARDALEEMRRLPRDQHSSDRDWELAEEVEISLFIGQTDDALRLASKFIDDRYFDRNKTDEVCGYLLIPLLQRGRSPQAQTLRIRCMRSYRPQRVYYWWFGNLLKFAALIGDLDGAVKRYGECQRAITDLTDPLHRLHFALDAIVIFDRLRAQGRTDVPLMLPESVPLPHPDGRYSVADLRAWLGQQATDLADRFDARNGNGHFREQLQERTGLQQWACGSPRSPGLDSNRIET